MMQRMKRTILELAEPIVTTYTQHAHLLSILGVHEATHPWIYSNYIHVFSNEKLSEYSWIDFYFPMPYELRPVDNCKFLITQKYLRSVVNDNLMPFMDFIKYAITQGFYVHAMLDYFHIPNSTDFEKQHRIHDTLIYGYDTNQEIIYGRDFLVNRKYSKIEIPFNKIELAFNDYKLAWNQDFLKGVIYLYSINDKCDYEFSVKNIFESIKTYLSASRLEYWQVYNQANAENIVCGMAIYSSLITYLFDKPDYLNILPFHLLCDHKKMMTQRFRFLSELGYVDKKHLNQLEEIENIAGLSLRLLLKYVASLKNSILNDVVDKIKLIEDMEYELLSKVIK